MIRMKLGVLTMRKFLIMFLIAGLFWPMASHAGIHGVLRGKVLDSEGQPAIGATVRVMGTTRGTFVKDQDGTFRLANIPAGTYEIKITNVGHKPATIKNAKISADQTTDIGTINMVSEVAETETVVITEDRMVDNDAVGSMTKMDNRQLTSTTSEGVQSVVGLTAGVSNSGGGFRIRGSRDSESQIQVDGLDVGNQFTGGFGGAGRYYSPMISAYATEEVQVLTGGFSVEYGNAIGGVVNTVAKRGNTDKYEGFARYRRSFGALYGSQHSSVEVVRDGNTLEIIEAGEGADLLATDEYTMELGGGGPLPLLNNSTFYVSGKFINRTMPNGFDISDPWGNVIQRPEDEQLTVRNISPRLRFTVTNDIQLVVGGQYGLTTNRNQSFNWLYANDPAIFYETVGTEVNPVINDVPERVGKMPVLNQTVTNIYAKINHTLSATSYYELRVSTTTNNDEFARTLVPGADADFFGGYDFLTPRDDIQVKFNSFQPGNDRKIDWYEYYTLVSLSKDGYLLSDFPQINPLTGYYEGNANASGSGNPWGLTRFFYTHPNTGFEFRKGQYFQIDGNYTNNLKVGDFNHFLKTGFEIRFYEQRRHSNQNPWDGNPFFDVYTDEWGGNFYVDSQEAKEATSQPVTPWRASAYVQDQIEYKNIIITPGLRFDYFNPDARFRTETQTFVSIDSINTNNFQDADPKFQLSPRINITYPLTDRSNISINYGLFFQMPQLQYLYDGFYRDQLRGNAILGQPNMEAQRSNQYEVSYNNQLTDDFSMQVKAYYKDIYNQVGMQYIPAVPQPYFQYTVADYGNAKGLAFILQKRPIDHIALNFNYSLAWAEGTSTSPTSNYLPPIDPYTDTQGFPQDTYPLGYDQRHRVNLIVDFIWGNDEGPSIGGIQLLENTNINLSGVIESGLPYTKLDFGGNPVSENNAERHPSWWQLDMRISKAFWMKDFFGDGAGDSQLELFIDFNNLLNRTAARFYYPRTDDPDDDGISLYRSIGFFSPVPYYEEANFGIAETFTIDQYDNYGNRLYSLEGDIDKNGIVTQTEKYQNYLDYIETLMAFRGQYQTPRRVYFGLMFRF